MMEEKPKVVILTGASGSGKSTLAEQLKELGYVQPVQFTTRKPRNEGEFDQYVFLTREQFFRKLENCDFAEYTEYNGNFYALGKTFSNSKPNVVILEPVGKAQVEKYCRINGFKCVSVFLEIDEETLVYRLSSHRKSSVSEIEERKKDFRYISPKGFDYVVDARDTSENVFRHVEMTLRNNGFHERCDS